MPSSIVGFGRYLPEKVLGNEELARRLGCEASWILQSSGIEERRIAADDQSVVDMGVAAAQDCLARACNPTIGMVMVSSGSSERRFPAPAAEISSKLGFGGIPAIDLPVASAGSLFAITLAAQLAAVYGAILVIASEKMSSPALVEPLDKNVAILFGDGAGACIVAANSPGLEIISSAIHSEGSYAADLRLEFTGPIAMNGYSVIMQASRKIPAVINEVLGQLPHNSVSAFIMHQANQNLIDRVARSVGVASNRFYTNIRRYGNTSSASMLIAASEWREASTPANGEHICFAVFGAGYHWGAILTRQTVNL